jgi:hypothetical protein
MLLGLALAPLTDQQQDGNQDAEEEQLGVPLRPQPQKTQQAICTPNAEAPLSSAAASSMTISSVDVAAKKVLSNPPPLELDRVTSPSLQAAEATAKSKMEAEAMAKASLEAARNKSNAAR